MRWKNAPNWDFEILKIWAISIKLLWIQYLVNIRSFTIKLLGNILSFDFWFELAQNDLQKYIYQAFLLTHVAFEFRPIFDNEG